VGFFEHGNEFSEFVRGQEFLDELIAYPFTLLQGVLYPDNQPQASQNTSYITKITSQQHHTDITTNE
jgi:hypothetical protein